MGTLENLLDFFQEKKLMLIHGEADFVENSFATGEMTPRGLEVTGRVRRHLRERGKSYRIVGYLR